MVRSTHFVLAQTLMIVLLSTLFPYCIASFHLRTLNAFPNPTCHVMTGNASLRRDTSTEYIHPMKHHSERTNKLNIHKRKKASSTALSNSPLASDFAAGGTLFLSTLIGITLNTIFKSGGGHVMTLLSSAMISNLSHAVRFLPRVPTEHFSYEWCWSISLPASLVFALLSSSSEMTLVPRSTTQCTKLSPDLNVTKKCIQGMAIPFVIGSIGSILGCMASFLSVPMPTSSISTVAKSTTSSAILAGCLCASYIGGTVNFFAAGKILAPLSNSNNMGNAFGSIAAADLVVMALYFTVLSAASKLSLLKKVFPSRACHKTIFGREKMGNSINTGAQTDMKQCSLVHKIGAISIAVSLAFSSVCMASRLEKIMSNHFNIPGTMCAFLGIFGLSLDKLIAMIHAFSSNHKLLFWIRTVLEQIPLVSPHLCNLSFFFLFAAVGITADVSSAVCGGPMALLFASFALMIHFTILLLGTYVISRIIHAAQTLGYRWPQPTWEEVLTASNAAIGGPSTAAAFATGLFPITNMNNSESYRRALVLSATIYGVFGYATGTSLGIFLTKLLIRWVKTS